MRLASEKHKQKFKVKEADRIEIVSLTDNSVDFLSAVNNQNFKSFRQWKCGRDTKELGKAHMDLPFAEHGFSVLIRVFSGDKASCVLFETGGSSNGMVENAERMSINLSEVECIVISHGHYDHFGGLISAVKAVGKVDLPIIVHENMFKTRGSTNTKGIVRPYPEFPTEKQLRPAQLVTTKKPSLAAGGMVCVTGEIQRKTSFETGYPQHKALVKGSWRSDPLIMDERAVVVNIKERGLVVLSGCAHAGIINTVTYAQHITETERVYAVMGGFHLAGKTFENRIQPTIEELQRINPKLIVPSHCTGWKAMCTIAKTFPEAFVSNSVGNLYKI
ncbi:MAG: MBL fold metallo-hydrolase [Candidatus Bathyarchaeota archaeon]|nr:MBL fold metallo-hydrolase [Candidatus Bathyarchaeota archaeon]